MGSKAATAPNSTNSGAEVRTRDKHAQDPENKEVETISPRKKHVKQHLGRTIWFVAHSTILVLGTYLFLVSLLMKKRFFLNRVIYRFDFALIATTYLASVYHYLEGESVRASVLLAMDSVQYGVIAILWIFMPTHASKTLPFTLISLLHVLDSIAPKLATKLSKPLSLAIGYANIAIFFKLIVDFFRIKHGASISLLTYGVFYRTRFHFSSVDRECAGSIYDAIDHRLSAKSTPEKIRGYWARTKKRVENYESVSTAESRKKEEEAIKKANADM